MSELLHSCLTAPLGLPVFLLMSGGSEIVLGVQYSAYLVEKLGNEQLFIVD